VVHHEDCDELGLGGLVVAELADEQERLASRWADCS
jgi:hypothetical protein